VNADADEDVDAEVDMYTERKKCRVMKIKNQLKLGPNSVISDFLYIL